jgi:uncharacterized protein YndB with AHSA1/START domain
MLVLERRVRAPLELVFSMLVDPDELRQWLGPADCSDTQFDGDVREGGPFVFRMHFRGGDYAADGVFREIVENERVVFTWRWFQAPTFETLDPTETLVTLAVREDGDFTVLTLTHARLPDETSAESHRSGWNDALDKLRARCERLEQGDRT